MIPPIPITTHKLWHSFFPEPILSWLPSFPAEGPLPVQISQMCPFLVSNATLFLHYSPCLLPAPHPRLDVQLLSLLSVLPTGWDFGEMNEAGLGLWRVGFFHINFQELFENVITKFREFPWILCLRWVPPSLHSSYSLLFQESLPFCFPCDNPHAPASIFCSDPFYSWTQNFLPWN